MKKLLALLLAFVMLASMLAACGSPDTTDTPDDENTPGGDTTDPSGDPSGDPTDQPDVPSTPSGTQTGLYTPTAQKQRETYELVTAEGCEDGPYLVETVYVSEQVIIANVVVTPEKYGVDPTGAKDSTEGIQKALQDCYAMGGGTVFLPVGQYVVTSTLKVPYGVVLQGDWQDPDLTSTPEYGTMIICKMDPLDDSETFDPTADPLIQLQHETDGNNGVIGMTFYYPDQDIKDVKPYGYTIYGGKPRMVMLRDLTFINSYQGIGACLGGEGTHELLQVENVRMTVLNMGYKASLSREIGYTVDLRISPKYWANAAEGFACPDPAALREFCRNYAIGMEFHALDLNQYTDLYIEGCHTALLSQQGFWGVFYDVEIKDCMYGFVAEGLNGGSGVTIAKADIEADVYAVANYAIGSGTLKLADVQATGKGGIHSALGAKTFIDNSDDLSKYDPQYATYNRPVSKLYVADVKGLDGLKKDAGPAIQEALDLAALTGGIVYIPHGIYSVYTPLSIATGVELRGSAPMAIRDKASNSGYIPGTVILTYVNEGDFITLAESAGVQGLRIFYPSYEHVTALGYHESGDDILNTSVAIRGKGARVYAMNMVISGALTGIDFTGCDNHVVKQSFGCAYNNFVRAGGKNGTIEAVLNNMTFTMRQPFFSRGYYDMDYINTANWNQQKEGHAVGWPTIRDKVLRSYNDVVYLIDAENETMNNVFMYGCHSILVTDNSSVVGYNVTSDWQGICPMFVFKNNSDAVIFNPLRTTGQSHEIDDSSSAVIYNRIINLITNEPTYRSDDGPENAVGEEIDKVELMDCDSNEGAPASKVNTNKEFIKDGRGSLQFVAGETPKTWLNATFAPVDADHLASDDTELFLHMWVWIDDPQNLVWSGNTIDLTTEDGSVYSWSTTSSLKGAGWNEVWLPLKAGWKGLGEMDLTGFKSLSTTVSYSELNIIPEVYFDDIYIAQMLPYTDISYQEGSEMTPYVRPEIPVEVVPYRIVINDCETLDHLGKSVIDGTTLNTDPKYVKEGKASLKYYVENPKAQVFFEMNIPATDASQFTNYGFLHMWIYVDRIEGAASGGSIEITSSGSYDQAERNWALSAAIKNVGWNEVWLPIHQGTASGTAVFDPSFLNYMRMFMKSLSGTTVYIDDVYLCNVVEGEYDESNTGKTGTALAAEEVLPVLHRCDNANGVSYVELCKDAQYIKEGKGSFISAPGQTPRLVLIFTPKDISAYMGGYLHMWIYIENPGDLRSGQIELTSGAKEDVEEICWQLKEYVTESGWNEVMIPLFNAKATETTGKSFDPTRLNFIRVYTQWLDGTSDYPMYFDDIYFVEGDNEPVTPDTPSTPTTPETPSTPSTDAPAVDASTKKMLVDGEEIVNGLLPTVELSSEYVKQGTTSLKSPSITDRFVYNFDATDVSAYADGYLHMWVYVTDFDNIDRGFIELTSGGAYDVEEICWPVKDHIKANGWNELWLPINAARGAGAADLTRVNYIRLYTNLKNNAMADMYFDDIYFINADPNAEDKTDDKVEPENTQKPDADGVLMLLDGESVPAGTKIEMTTSTDYVKQGKTSLKSTSTQVRLETNFGRTDISAYENGYLHMWVYVTDFANINRGYIELTSSGAFDVEEMCWRVQDYLKQDGWNELWLPLADAIKPTGDQAPVNMKGVNYLRMYTIQSTAGAAADMYFDDIYFAKTK